MQEGVTCMIGVPCYEQERDVLVRFTEKKGKDITIVAHV